LSSGLHIGWVPFVRAKCIIIPIAQISTLFVYFYLHATSGAIKVKVPQYKSLDYVYALFYLPRPKSIILTVLKSLMSSINIFPGFKSLWMTPLSWKYETPDNIPLINYAASKSLSDYLLSNRSFIYWCKLFPGK
jgi:hypothetical protein